jgi:hypothetical protein
MATRSFPILCIAAIAATLPSVASADGDPWAHTPDRAPAAALADATRPHLVGGALYWASHDLAEICAVAGGRFAKVAGSSVYVCDLE